MKQLVDAIQKQMQANDLLDARANLLKWGQLIMQNSSSVTLQALASKLDDPVLSQGFFQLDQHLYQAESTEMSDQTLIIERLKMHSKEATYADPKKQLGLQPLYPQDTSR